MYFSYVSCRFFSLFVKSYYNYELVAHLCRKFVVLNPLRLWNLKRMTGDLCVVLFSPFNLVLYG